MSTEIDNDNLRSDYNEIRIGTWNVRQEMLEQDRDRDSENDRRSEAGCEWTE